MSDRPYMLATKVKDRTSYVDTVGADKGETAYMRHDTDRTS